MLEILSNKKKKKDVTSFIVYPPQVDVNFWQY